MTEKDRRGSPRHSITLYTEYVERASSPTRILNMSESGFLIRGDFCAGTGGVIRASFKVRPASGEASVTARGTVMRSRRTGDEYEYGVMIEGFGSEEEERNYRSYVRELILSPPSA